VVLLIVKVPSNVTNRVSPFVLQTTGCSLVLSEKVNSSSPGRISISVL